MYEIFPVFPKSFKVVKIPFFVAENMHYYVGVVQNRPPTFAYTFAAAGSKSVLFVKKFF